MTAPWNACPVVLPDHTSCWYRFPLYRHQRLRLLPKSFRARFERLIHLLERVSGLPEQRSAEERYEYPRKGLLLSKKTASSWCSFYGEAMLTIEDPGEQQFAEPSKLVRRMRSHHTWPKRHRLSAVEAKLYPEKRAGFRDAMYCGDKWIPYGICGEIGQYRPDLFGRCFDLYFRTQFMLIHRDPFMEREYFSFYGFFHDGLRRNARDPGIWHA